MVKRRKVQFANIEQIKWRRATRTQSKPGSELWCSGRESSSLFPADSTGCIVYC